MHDADGVLVLMTLDRLDRVGTASVWRKDPDGWQRVGALGHVVPPQPVAGGTTLSPGPTSQQIMAIGLAGDRVAFSRDGGATWTYLAPPMAYREHGYSHIAPTTKDVYITNHHTAMRAAFGASAWEKVSLPRRSASLLALEDALLDVDSDCDNTTNHYWVSRDRGDSWSKRRHFPAGTCIYGWTANTAYTADAYETQWWRSTDLVHWKHAPTSPYEQLARNAQAACPASLGKDPATNRYDEPPLRIGDDVYKLFHLSNRDGRKLELRVSDDDCHTWKPALR